MINFYEYHNEKLDLYSLYYHPLDATMGCKYADEIMHIIKKDAECAYLHARITDTRWSEAEPYIMTNSYCTYMYAKFVMRERWPEAEPIIESDEYWWMRYKKEFLE